MNEFLFWTLDGVIFALSGFIVALSVALFRQRRAEAQLRQANMVVENSPAVLFRWKAAEGWPVELVSSNVVRFGYSREELLSGAVSYSSMVHPDDLERVAAEVREYTSAGIDRFQQEYRFIARDGGVRWIDDRTVVERDKKGRVTHYQGIVLDITDRKKAENALRESEQKFRVLAETAPPAIVLLQDDEFVYVNPAMCRITGYSEGELLGMKLWEWAPEDDWDLIRERGRARLRGEPVPSQYEQRVLTRDGELRWVIVSAGAVEFRDKPAVIASLLDITEAKRVEEKLRQSEELLVTAFRTSLDSASINRMSDGLFLAVNDGFCAITGYSSDEVIGRTSRELNLWVDNEDRERLIREMTASGFVTRMEIEFRRKDGSIFYHQMSARRIDIDGVPCMVIVGRDITDQKRADEQLRASLEEKTVLLKEVHHRVKNNLQIISSLLELQSDFIADEESRRFIRESQNRIGAMALVHEKLYQSEFVASINLGDYIESLTQYLFSTFVRDTEAIGLTVEVEDVHLAIDEAIPCGLIVNELVSNALKHAFPIGVKGDIAVRCRSGKDGLVTVTVSDTGIGLPAGFDIENAESLGLQLVTMLVKQLRGAMRLVTERGGTTVMISFPGGRSLSDR